MSVEERRTTAKTKVCIPCGYIFIDDDDYDTLGAEKCVCCPDCGSEEFVTVAAIITQRDALLEACKRHRDIHYRLDGKTNWRLNYPDMEAAIEAAK